MHHYTIFLRADTITRTDGGEAIVTTILSHCKQQQFLSAYMYHFFYPSAFFSSGRGSFLVLLAPCHTGSLPGPNTHVWAPAEFRSCHVIWGLKEPRSLGEAFQVRRAIQAHANPYLHITLLRCWKYPMSHEASGILNAINVVRYYIPRDGKVILPNQHDRHETIYSSEASF